MVYRMVSAMCLAAPGVFLAGGCGASTQPASPTNVQVTMNDGDEEHGHVPGAHGGTIVSVGRDSYHVEAVFAEGGLLKLFTLGRDETRVIDVERQVLTGYVKAPGSERSTAVTFQPEPQPGDSEGKTSQFVAALPPDLDSHPLEVTIPSVRIDGERFRIAFASQVAEHEAAMPEKVADEDEEALYLTPGGKYTADDIEANGRMTVSQKFKGFKAAHDMHPKTGDKVCPITLTKANPKCAWVVAGKEYEFCCPPCVDEFIRMAKKEPEKIEEPSAYIKR
jgi:hypothetical protein